MPLLNGLKILLTAAVLFYAVPGFAEIDAQPKGLNPATKAQLDAAIAGAKAVPVMPVPATPKTDTAPAVVPAPTPANTSLPATAPTTIDDSDVQDMEPLPPVANDAEEIEPLKVSLDKPEIVHLDRDAINVIVGSNENLRVVPDTNKTLVLIAKKPGSTYFRALDADGKVIMQRHVIIGSPTKNYIRIRRACANGAEGCKQYSVYYCPDMCHEVNVVQDSTGPSAAIPEQTPAGVSTGNSAKDSGDQPPTDTSKTAEPPPGE